jgi:PKD repeat protein/photosystem II stability/assembly factor-like uncharacterized protein
MDLDSQPSPFFIGIFPNQCRKTIRYVNFGFVMKTYTLLLVILLSANAIIAQSIDTSAVPVWAQMMDDPNADFYETQKAFELYFEGRERQPGDGWKVFKRWENHWQDYLNPDGTRMDVTKFGEAFEQWEILDNQINTQGAESTNGAWEEVGPIDKPYNGTGQPNGNGRLNAIGFHPTDEDVFWVGAPAGGLWKTTDGGDTWSSNTDDLATLGVSSIVVNPSNTNIMYIGTGDRDAGDAPGRGVYKSVDGGANWTQSNSGMGNLEVNVMVMHPSNPSYIVAATSGGIYRSQNAGSTWNLESSNTSSYKDLKFRPGSSTVLYTTETSGQAGFYRSTNGGDTWTQITSGLPSTSQRYSIGVSADDPNVVYLIRSVGSAYGGLYKSTTSGLSFTTQSTTPNLLGWAENGSGSSGQGWYDLAIEVDPDDADVVYIGGVNVWKSTNSGVNWDCVGHWVGSSTAAAIHADHHWFAFSPVNGYLYSCNDGGLHYSADNGNTWPELSAGLGIAQLYKLGVSQQTHELVINGYQDNGTAIWDDTIFRTERGGDGMECIIDYSDDDYMYASVYYGNIARSTNNGYSFGGFAANNTNGITESGAWVTPYILDKDNPNVMFIGYKNVWRTTTAKSGSVSFSAISNSLAGSNSSNMRQLRQSKVDGNRLYAIRSDNKLFRSDNALASAPTWTDLTSYLPFSGTVRDIETDPLNNDIVWVSINNQIWKSFNGGTSWSNITGNLPNLSYNTVIADPLSDGGLYVGGYTGIYYVDDNLSNWVSFYDDFPDNVQVRELEIYRPQGNWQGSRIRAATYGRGLWESDLYDPGTLAPMAFMDLSLDSTDICSSDTIQLYNNSAYGVDSTLWEIEPSNNVSFVNGTSDTSMNPMIVLSDTGYYSVKLTVTNGNGSDSIIADSAIVLSTGLSFPWFDDFEDEIPCASGGCATNCEVVHWSNVPNGNGDDIDWRPDNEGTPWSDVNYNGGNTGPSADYDPGTYEGHYLYVSSYPPNTTCYNYLALLESPCLNLDNVTAPEIKFAYHMFGYGPGMNDIEVDVYSSGSWTNLWSQTGTNLGDQWNVDSIGLSSFVGESIKLRFAGTSGSNWRCDLAIDGIELTAAPYADFSVSDTFPCLNETVSIIDESSQSPTSWSWTITPNTFNYVNGTNSNSQNPQIEFTNGGSYSIVLFATNQYGNDFESKASIIEINIPEATLVSGIAANTFCEEDIIEFQLNETGYVNYDFFENGLSNQSGSNYTFNESSFIDGDQYYCIVTDSNGCFATSNIITISVFGIPSSALVSSDDDDEICEGDTVTFTALNTNLSNYNFQLNGSSEQSSGANNWISSNLISNDEVWVTITDTNGCTNSTDTITTSVLPLPATPGISAILDSLMCSIPGEMYRWQFDDSVSTNNNQTVPKYGDGNYRVRIFEDGCWSLWSSPFIITGFAGIDDLSVKVYPSPATDHVYVEFVNGLNAQNASMKLIDMSGKLVFESDLMPIVSNNRTEIPLNNFASGVYTIILNVDSKNYAVPIVKERP